MALGELRTPNELAAEATPQELTHGRSTVLRAYLALMKPRIMTLLLFTTVAALLMATRTHHLGTLSFLRVLLATTVGGMMASGGAAALNCYIDRDIDQVMARTRRRAIPAGILTAHQVLAFGLALSAGSIVVLASLTNVLAAALALAGNLFYVLIYTAWLKRSTSQNIVIGGIAGAIPPLVGWAAVTGGLSLAPMLLLVIITYWTPAHFWSLALSIRRDYSRAGVPMLPSVTSEAHARWQILVYTLLVVIASLLLYSINAAGLIYLFSALGLGGVFVFLAFRLRLRAAARDARTMFMFSNLYLAALFGAMILDSVVH